MELSSKMIDRYRTLSVVVGLISDWRWTWTWTWSWNWRRWKTSSRIVSTLILLLLLWVLVCIRGTRSEKLGRVELWMGAQGGSGWSRWTSIGI